MKFISKDGRVKAGFSIETKDLMRLLKLLKNYMQQNMEERKTILRDYN